GLFAACGCIAWSLAGLLNPALAPTSSIVPAAVPIRAIKARRMCGPTPLTMLPAPAGRRCSRREPDDDAPGVEPEVVLPVSAPEGGALRREPEGDAFGAPRRGGALRCEPEG